MVLATSMSITEVSMEADPKVVPSLEVSVLDKSTLPFKCMLCIYYLFCFKKDQHKIQALINSNNKVNAITSTYIKKLGYCT